MEENKKIPYNIDIEKAVLGALLIDNTAFYEIEHIINKDVFYYYIHKDIFIAIIHIITKDQIEANSHTVKSHLKNKIYPELDIGEYLKLLENEFSALNSLENHFMYLKDLFVRRKTIILVKKVGSSAENEYDKDINLILKNLNREVINLSSDNPEATFISLDGEIDKTVKEIEESYHNKSTISGVTSGFIDLDNLIGGIDGSQIIVIGGSPSIGKTSLALNMAMNVAKSQKNVFFLTLDSTKKELMSKVICSESKISSYRIRTGKMRREEYQKIDTVCDELIKLGLIIYDDHDPSIFNIIDTIKSNNANKDISIIFIDYLQLLQRSSSGRSFENRTHELSLIMQSLKKLANEMKIPIIILSQLSRNFEQRDSKIPQLNDLKDSSSIEEIADIVMFVHRKSYYLARGRPEKGTDAYTYWKDKIDEVKNEADIIVAKNRYGAMGSIKLHFDPNITLFSDLQQN